MDLVTKNVLADIQPHMAWIKNIDDLKQCCWERACMRNFKDIPLRVNIGNGPISITWKPLYRDATMTCCGLPRETPDMVASFLPDVTDDYANMLFAMDYDVVMPGNCKEVAVIYKVQPRKQDRHRCQHFRRNVINAVLFMDRLNSYVHLHQTYRYKPRKIEVEVLLKMIFREAIGQIKEYYKSEDCSGYFCTCHLM
jgi:hypothetical protein